MRVRTEEAQQPPALPSAMEEIEVCVSPKPGSVQNQREDHTMTLEPGQREVGGEKEKKNI